MQNSIKYLFLSCYKLVSVRKYYGILKFFWGDKMKFKLTAVLMSLLILTSCSSESSNNASPTMSVPNASPTAFKSSGELKVHFIDVGQGDSILVQTPGGKVMLIDAGKKEDGSKVINYIKSQGVQKIDALVNTNPDDEHLGGLAQVVNSFDVANAYITKKSVSSTAQTEFLNAIKTKKVEKTQALAGLRIDIDPLVDIQMTAPNNSSNYANVKDYSAVIKLTYGNESFMFTGDALSQSEGEMLESAFALNSTVLKVSNHGNKASTSTAFLNAVSPKYAVISVGKGNPNGDPSKEVLDSLTKANAQIFRTDESGTILATTDGLTLNIGKATASAQASPAASAAPSPAATK